MKAKHFTVFLFILLMVSGLAARDMERDFVFKKAVSAYAGENYQDAIALFSQLAESGEVSWELYYNLGNAHYRNGDLGQAIQYWEKAKVLAPSQQDINHNLAMAEQLLIDKVVLPDMFPLFKWYAQVQQRLPLNVALLAIGLLLTLMLLLIGAVRHRERLKGKPGKKNYIAIATVFMSLILILTAVTVSTAHKRHTEKYAIVLEDEVHILSEPSEDAAVLFILHEGSKVRVNKKIEDTWSNISYFDDKVGWVRQSGIGEIEK